MKHFLRSIAAVAAIVAIFGCKKENFGDENLVKMTFHAGWADETKTALQEDGTSIWWSPGDEISVFVGSGENGGYKFTSSATEACATTKFKGEIGDHSGTYFALYPYDPNAICFENGNIKTTIPAEQVAKEGSFPEGSFLSVAYSTDNNLYFKNACSGIKFTVDNENISKIVFSSNNATPLAGLGFLYTRTNENPYIPEGSYSITLTAPNGGTFKVGSYYYVSLNPDSRISGLNIEFYTADNKYAMRSLTVSSAFKKGIVKRLYDADKGLTFIKHYDSVGALYSHQFLPDGIDKTTITQAYFHVSDPTTTDTVISEGDGTYYAPVYFEMKGTEAHYYTSGQVYKCSYPDFEGWKSLKSLDLSMFDVSDADNMSQAFNGCYSLESIDLSSFETGKVQHFNNMFKDCVNLRTLDVSNFDTSSAIDMYAMFSGCSSLSVLDVSNFNTSAVSDFSYMFYGCSGLVTLDVSNFDTSNATSLNDMLAGLSVTTIDVSGFNTSNVTKVAGLFSGDWYLKKIDISSFDTHNVTDFSYMFGGCRSLESIDLSPLDMSSATGLDGLFQSCTNLKNLTMPTSTAYPKYMQYMFENCNSLEEIDLSHIDTRDAVQMFQMFYNCTKLKSLNLSNFDTRNVTSMSHMFQQCSNLVHLDISSFDSSSLTEAYAMFYDTYKLTSLDLGDFNLENISIDSAGCWLGDFTQHCYIRCSDKTKAALIATASGLNDKKYTWYTDGTSLPDVDFTAEDGLYISSDFSKDKTVRTVQLAEDGSGIDLVLMGDAYSDRLIADGTYDKDMNSAIDEIFAVEPFKSFKSLFNIYVVYAVSENEEIGKSTALSCTKNGVTCGSEDWSWISYYFCAVKNAVSANVSPMIVLHNDTYGGTATGFLSWTSDDYMNDPTRDDYNGGASEAVAYVSGPGTDEFGYTVRHEFGHSFGYLMDEYSDSYNAGQTIPDDVVTSWKLGFAYGMWKNVDLVSDNTVKWQKFIDDSRYSGTGIGVYEGALYPIGAWRSSKESIMNSTDSGFNAPSREAIYYRIHKLAYGKDWQYNFEDFVAWDQKNIAAEKAAASSRIKRSTKSVTVHREPMLETSKVIGPDGKERIKIVMN